MLTRVFSTISIMEGLEMEEFPSPNEVSEDICFAILSRYKSSPVEHHQHLCTVVGAISQELKDHDLPLTPISYFGATISSLDRLYYSASSSLSDPVVAALLTLLSTALPKVSTTVLRSKGVSVSAIVSRILGFGSVASVMAVKAGLKCISHLMIIGEKVSWESVAPMYSLLLGFITDSRPKVRKHSHSCLRDVLLSFQGSAILALASEAVTNVFERFLLLAGGSNLTGSTSGEGPKGAMEVIYILSALKDCLPLMSTKFTNGILKYLKSLLELQQPIVTRHIMNTLHMLCSSQSSQVAPELLLDLLCLLASSLFVREKSADVMTFTVRLLHVGIVRVYALNRDICVVKLPIIFNTLGDVLACEHEEVIFAATEALKGLISTCLDESLIKQGVEQIKPNLEGGTRRSGPTIIEKICATVESLLGYQYIAVWDMSFTVLSTMFDKLEESSMYLMRGTMKSLADMEKIPDEDLAYRKQLHECIGSALGAMGPEIFLSLLPLKLDVEDLSEANLWLFPILKQYTVGARLSFFTRSILGLVGLVQQKSQMFEKGQIFSSRSTKGLVYSLWSLLPACCNYPVDTASSFLGLTNALCNALREESDLRGIICCSLQILIQQNKIILEESTLESNREVSIAEQRARARYTMQIAADNLNAIKSSSPDFFSVLSGIFIKSLKDTGGCLQSTIGAFASISDKKVVKRFFTNTMQKLLKVTQDAVKAEQSTKCNSMQIDSSANDISPSLARAQLLDLAVSLLPGLDAKEVDLLFVAIKPALQDEEGLVQKKAYKILSIILRQERGNEFLSSKLDELLELMIEVLTSCHFSAKRHRLDSLYFLIVHVSKDASQIRKREIITSFLTEIVLALKEANKKTRNRAYGLLVKIGHSCGDEEQGGKKENLQLFFNMVAGGLAGETPQMISAAVKGLARLAYEFSDLITAAYNLLPSAFLLLQRKNREIVKANLGLIKVLVAKSQAEGLHTHLKSMVEGLLKWQDDTKSHFKAKVKLLLEMLVRKCGLDAVKAVMPEEHRKLLTNLRKTRERKERKRAVRLEEETKSLNTRTSDSRFSRWNHTNVFSDFGEDTDDSDAEHMDIKTVLGRGSKAITSQFTSKASSRSTRKRQAAKSLPEDLFDQMEDDPLDLLDRHKTRSSLRSSTHLKRKPESDDEPEIDSNGRLVIREDRKLKRQESLSDRKTDAKSQAGSHVTTNTLAKSHKRQKTLGSGWAYTGSEYKSKKAGGDLKRKDKLEPYAYWPLDRKMLSRRGEQKAIARKGMSSVMKLTKKLEGKSASSALSAKVLKIKRKQKGGKKSG